MSQEQLQQAEQQPVSVDNSQLNALRNKSLKERIATGALDVATSAATMFGGMPRAEAGQYYGFLTPNYIAVANKFCQDNYGLNAGNMNIANHSFECFNSSSYQGGGAVNGGANAGANSSNGGAWGQVWGGLFGSGNTNSSASETNQSLDTACNAVFQGREYVSPKGVVRHVDYAEFENDQEGNRGNGCYGNISY